MPPRRDARTAGQRIAKWVCTEDGPGPRGVRYKAGVPRQTWQVIAELGQYNYVMEESDEAGMATRCGDQRRANKIERLHYVHDTSKGQSYR